MRLTRRALGILNTSMSMNTNQRVSAEDLGRAFQDLPVSVEHHGLRFPLDEALMVNSHLLFTFKATSGPIFDVVAELPETNCHGSADLEATESVERMWVPKTLLCALRESGKTPNTIAGECLACSGHVVQTGLLFVLAALLVVALMVGAERNLDFLTLMVGASQFVMLLQVADGAGEARCRVASGRGQVRTVPALVALLFIVTFGHVRLAKVPLRVNTAVGSTGTAVHNVLPGSRTHLLGAFRVLEQPQQNEVHCGASTCAVRGIHVKNRLHCCRVSSASCCKEWRREYCCPGGSM